MKGSYLLIIRLKKDTIIRVGALGQLSFRGGYYAYSGSALNSLESRISRHLGDSKKIFWHVDYLLELSQVISVWTVIHCPKCKARQDVEDCTCDNVRGIAKPYGIDSAESEKRMECRTANIFSSLCTSVKGFGSSDCSCPSHLFFSQDKEQLENIAKSLEYKLLKQELPSFSR